MVSTKAHTLSAALKQLARFEGDPANYGRKPPEAKALYLTEELADEFIAWSRDEKQNSPNWVSTQRIYLAWWRETLFGRDLRKLNLRDDIDAPLTKHKAGRPHRIKVLKALM